MTSLFISHSSADQDAAQRASLRLQNLGYASVFLDTDPDDGIQPGRRWERELYGALRRTDAVIFLVTDAAIESRWCFAELAFARSLGRPVFPARISGTARHELIAETQEVDLSDPDRGFRVLAAGLRRAGLDPQDSYSWDPARSPYPGLNAFTSADAAVFFGRQAEIGRLLDLIHPSLDRAPGRWVCIVGPSGSGKSSLLHAGLLPRLARMPDRWIVVPPMAPGTDPTRQLASCLAAALVERGRPVSVDELGRRLGDADTATSALLQQIDALRLHEARSVIIVVDQAEELIIGTGPREQSAFLRLLGEALSRDSGLWVVSTLRSEFLSTAPERAGLVEIIDDSVVIEPLSRARLPEVITRPAWRAGLDFEPGLVERMVEASTGGDAMSLLAYTLHELAERADGVISLADYEAVGGVVGALRRRTDRLVDDLTRRGQGPLIVPTLMKLASVDADGTPVRRRIPRSALTPDEATVVDAFIHARLLTSSGGTRSAGEPAMVEVSHETLLRQWEPLRLAIEIAQDSLRTRADLGREAADWLSGGRDESYLLRGTHLELIDDWASGNGADINELEAEFLTVSRAAAARQMDAVRRGYRRLQWLSVGLAVFLVGSLVASVVAVWQGREADNQASLASARQLLAQADLTWGSQPDAALLLHVEALRRMPENDRGEARYALVSKLNRPFHVSTLLIGHTGEVGNVVFAADGSMLATAGDDGSVRFWDPGDGHLLGQLPLMEPRPVRSLTFSPDGSTLAVASGATVQLWDTATRRSRTPPLVGHTDDVVKAVFTPDGALVATISLDTTIRIWDAASGEPSGQPLAGHTDYVFDAAFTPDGSTLVSAAWDDQVRLWDVPSGRAGLVLKGHENDVTAIAVSTDGSTVVSAAEDGTVRLWDLRTGRPGPVLDGHDGPVSSLALSPDGSIIASGDDRMVRLWSGATGAPLGQPLAGHTDVVIGLKFASDGTLVSAGVDGTLRIWDVGSVSALGSPLIGHTSFIRDMTVSPDGRTVASASGDGTARLWPIVETRLLGQPLADDDPGPYYDVAIGAADTVAAAGADGSVHLWDARTLVPTGRLAGHRGSVDAVAFGPGGVLASAGADTTIRLWDVARREPARPPLIAGDPVLGLAFSRDGRLLASAGTNGSVRLWNVADGRLLGALTGHDRNVNAVAFGPSGILASGGDDRTVRLWDTTTRQPIGAPIAAAGTVRDVAISPDGTLLAAGGSDAAIQFWDTDTRAPRGDPLTGFKNWVNRVAFNPDGMTIAAAADDRFQLWDVATSRPHGAPLIATGERVHGAAFSPDGSILAAASEASILVWAIQDDALTNSACRLANRNLTDAEWKRFLGPSVDYLPTCP